MLSFLYQLARQFQSRHGYKPNVLYLNHNHFKCLQQELAAIRDLDELTQFLGMEIVLVSDANQPHLAWSPVDWHGAVAV